MIGFQLSGMSTISRASLLRAREAGSLNCLINLRKGDNTYENECLVDTGVLGQGSSTE